jgi:ribA/ribD-fused uncharacterized protein
MAILIEDRITDTHVYFWGDPTLSNWGPAPFTYKGKHFANSEQAFMWEKAMCFGDTEIANEILKTSNPKNAKDLGRLVKNYKEDIWATKRYKAMVDVCLAKFSQNKDRLETLLSTGDRILVEGSPYDTVWGVGIHWAEEEILDEKNWRGQNLLGKSLMEVRTKLGSNE